MLQQGYIPDQPKHWQSQHAPPPDQGMQPPVYQPQPQYSPPPPLQYQQQTPQYQAPARQVVRTEKPRKKRSVPLLISAVLGLAFVIVLVTGATDLVSQRLSQEATTLEEVGTQLGMVIGFGLMIPQMVMSAIAVILNAVGWGTNIRGFALAGAIVYCVAAVLMITNALFLLPSIVLSFVGFAKIKKMD